MKLTKLFFAAVIVLSASASFAQGINQISPTSASHLVNINIQDVALLGLVSSTETDITLEGTAPTVAGEAMNFDDATDSSIWLNYSSIPKGGVERKITVKITDGTVPTGLKLTVQTTNSATGNGKLGTIVGGAIDIPSATALSAATILEGITSAFTGSGSGQGHNLTYKLGYTTSEADDYAKLDEVIASELTITYTLSEI